MYNNFLYALAASVGEKLSGQTWEELVQAMLLDVLGMKETTFINQTGVDTAGIATPYMSVKGLLQSIDMDVHRYLLLKLNLSAHSHLAFSFAFPFAISFGSLCCQMVLFTPSDRRYRQTFKGNHCKR